MKVAFFRKTPWLSLLLFLLTFTSIGWYLSAYNLIWSIWSLVVVFLVTVGIIWFGDDVLRWIGIGSQGLFVVSGLTIVACLAVLASGLFSQVVILLAAEFLARVEMKSAGFSKNHSFCVLAIAAGLGLCFGWAIGVMFLPSAGWRNFPAN